MSKFYFLWLLLPILIFAETVDRPLVSAPDKPLLSPARNCYEISWGGFIIGEFLYWKAEQDNLQIGNIVDNLGTPVDPIQDGKVLQEKFSYSPGFRVGGGLKTAIDYGDFTFLWTKFDTHTKTSAAFAPSPAQIRPYTAITPSFINAGTECFAVNDRGVIHFKDFDFDWSRTTQMTKRIFFTPRAGFRFSEIKESIQALFLSNAPDQSFVCSESHTFKGWGLKAGLDGKWDVNYGIGVFADVSGSLYISTIRFKTNTTQIIGGVAPSQSVTILKSKNHRVRPMVDLVLGLNGNWCFAKRFAARVSVGYELQYWWNNFERPDPQQNMTFSDLSFQGCTAAAGLDF